MREVSAEGRTFIENFEGFVDHAYRCPAGVLTIGYGHTLGVKPGQTMTRAEADATLAMDLLSFGARLDALLGDTPTTGHQFDAMESLAFNIGFGDAKRGVEGFETSSVLRLHRKGDTAGAARSFGLWNKATVDGVLTPLAGLTRRRAAEAAVYLTPEEAPHPMPLPAPVDPGSMPQAVAAPPSAAKSKTMWTAAGIGASGVGVISDNVNQVNGLVAALSDAGASAAGLWVKLGHAAPAILGVVIVAGAAFLAVRYLIKLRRGDVVST
jgi:lysozyme